MRFEWDPEKDQANQDKHGVDFMEAVTVFEDAFEGTLPDDDHSISEPRFRTIGMSSQGRLLVVISTQTTDAIRIISARPATSSERRRYENE